MSASRCRGASESLQIIVCLWRTCASRRAFSTFKRGISDAALGIVLKEERQ